MRLDYTEITELPGSYLNAEQLGRFVHRYAMSTALRAAGPWKWHVVLLSGWGALQSTGRAVTGLVTRQPC